MRPGLRRAAGSAVGVAACLSPGEGGGPGDGGGAMRGGVPLGLAGLALLLMAAAPWAGARPRLTAPGDQPRPSVVLVACDSLVSVWGRVAARGRGAGPPQGEGGRESGGGCLGRPWPGPRGCGGEDFPWLCPGYSHRPAKIGLVFILHHLHGVEGLLGTGRAGLPPR